MATIIIRNSTGSGAVPSSLVQGELAINTIDGKLFYGSGSGNIVKEFTGSGGGGGSTFPYTGSAGISGSLNVNGPFTASSALISGNVTVLGTASISTLIINQTILSTGSNQLGDAVNDTQTLYGSVIIPTGSLTVTGSTIISSSASTQLRVGSNLLFVSSSGNVGIGTITPAYNLDLYGTYHQYQAQGLLARYDISSANVNQNRGVWDFYTNAAATPDFFGRFGFKFEGGTADSFKQFQVHIADSTTPKFVVDGSGRVGIGTITPTASLHISASNSSSAYSFLVQNSSGQTLIGVQNDRTVNINSTNGANGGTTIGTTNGSITFNQGYNNVLAGNALTFYNGGAASTIQGWSTNPGIGIGYTQTTTQPNPGTALAIRGTVTTSGSGVLFVTGSSTTKLLTIASEVSSSILVVSGSGNIGVGTSNPSANIHIVNSSSAAFRLQNIGGSSADFSISAGNGRLEMVGNNASAARITLGQFAKTVGINQQSPNAALHVVGAGATSATTAFLVQNSTPTTLFQIQDHGSSSFAGNVTISGSTLVGSVASPALNDTTRVTANIGVTTIYSVATGSYDGAFFDYTIRSGSNARAGQIMGLWSGSSVNFTETTTTDFGSTSNFTFGMNISASNMILSGSTTSNGWTVKTIVRSI